MMSEDCEVREKKIMVRVKSDRALLIGRARRTEGLKAGLAAF